VTTDRCVRAGSGADEEVRVPLPETSEGYFLLMVWLEGKDVVLATPWRARVDVGGGGTLLACDTQIATPSDTEKGMQGSADQGVVREGEGV
jgi:hypothetical protein